MMCRQSECEHDEDMRTEDDLLMCMGNTRQSRWFVHPRICMTSLIGCAWLLSLPIVSMAANLIEPTHEHSEPEFAFYAYLHSSSPSPALVGYHPTHDDPRHSFQGQKPTISSIRRDLEALHAAFDGLILYAYRGHVTPRIVEQAVHLGYRAVILGIWDPTSRTKLEGIRQLVHQYGLKLSLAVCVGNEGLTFGRYTLSDLTKAAQTLRQQWTKEFSIPICTSEPLYQYANPKVQAFGDFLCPNIHPVFDRPDLAPGEAARWVRKQARLLSLTSQKAVLVKETGFPHGGAPQFTQTTQTQFWEVYLSQPQFLAIEGTMPTQRWVSFAAAFEAFDQLWKAEQSGHSMEGAWGFMDNARRPYSAAKIWRMR